jgi:hypothetical protein
VRARTGTPGRDTAFQDWNFSSAPLDLSTKSERVHEVIILDGRGRLFKARLALTLGLNLTQCFGLCVSPHLFTSKLLLGETFIYPDKISEEISLNS